MNLRQRALLILLNVFQNNHSLEVQGEDPWVKALCFGILKKTSQLDYLLKQFSKRSLGKKDLKLRLIIYIGLYQLLFMESKTHAAVFETVELTKKNQLNHASGFVNALLQNIVRQGFPTIPIETTYNHPLWLLSAIQKAYPEQWQMIIIANNEHPPLFLRYRDPYACVELLDPVAVEKIPGFSEGRVSIQDFAAQQAAFLLDLREGLRVLDACAAPGGKTAHILETAKVRLLAVDQVRPTVSATC